MATTEEEKLQKELLKFWCVEEIPNFGHVEIIYCIIDLLE